MAPAVARDLKLTYGGFVVGGTTERLIHGKIGLFEDYENFSIELDIIVGGDTEAAFVTACTDLEAAFRKPDQAALLEIGSKTLRTYDPAANTGFNIRANADKFKDEPDGGRRRGYTITIEGGLPADLTGRAGRQSSTVVLDFANSRRRTVTVSGVYTALGSNSARAQYNTAIGAYTTAILSAFGGTYELLPEIAVSDDQDKVLQFTRVFEEIIFNQASTTLDHPAIKAQTIIARQLLDEPGDSPRQQELINYYGAPIVGVAKALRPVEVVVRADMDVDKDVTTDLESLFLTTVLPHLLNIAGTLTSGASALINRSFEPDFPNNRITAEVRFQSFESNIIQHTLTTEIFDTSGAERTPIWAKSALAKHRFQGPRTVVRRVTQRILMTSGAVSAVVGRRAGSLSTPRNDPDKMARIGISVAGDSDAKKGIWDRDSELQRSLVIVPGLSGREVSLFELTTEIVDSLYVEVTAKSGATITQPSRQRRRR